jgi:hypothetical protein
MPANPGRRWCTALAKGSTTDALCSSGEQSPVPARMTCMHLEQGSRQKVCSFMQTSTQYRAFADECLRLAKAAKSENERNVLEEMAATWKMLAEEAERKISRSGS